ncbi:cupin domain-containing protein [Methylophaga sp. OBS4]|uniref:cupin domain-containing protein n=1 Tax=Methylophaga sp. OBS4 TaxID=2991935 RepID=UPI00224C9F06|nr:cupin domain-containing protein [Methylophaga sp. OBS4]MCX4187289.1 cupin domain-containing protein [Methylophaga sp. OBS4]
MKIISFGKFGASNSTPITTDLDGWKPVEGSPTMKTWIEHVPADGKLLTGFWEATPGTYQVTYNADEMVHMFEGKATLTEDNGESVTYVGGDSFLVEAGFKGTWKTEETVRKIFAIRMGQDVTAPFGD